MASIIYSLSDKHPVVQGDITGQFVWNQVIYTSKPYDLSADPEPVRKAIVRILCLFQGGGIILEAPGSKSLVFLTEKDVASFLGIANLKLVLSISDMEGLVGCSVLLDTNGLIQFETITFHDPADLLAVLATFNLPDSYENASVLLEGMEPFVHSYGISRGPLFGDALGLVIS